MKKLKVISFKNLPVRIPFWGTAVIYLLMDKFNPSELVWGIVIAIWGLIFIFSIIACSTQETVNIFEKKEGKE